ncbi:hypothetical protein GCM10018952_19930 [Streptosporangium vulgare]
MWTKTGQRASGSCERKWKTCCWVTRSGGQPHRHAERSGEFRQPGTRGDDDGGGGHLRALGAQPDASVGQGLGPGEPHAGDHLGAQLGRPVHRGGHGRVGVDRARLRVVQHRSLEAHERPPLGRGAGGEQLVRHARLRQQPGEPFGVASRAEVDAAGDAEQRRPGVVLQLAPELPGQAGEAYVLRVGVGAAVDP